MGDTNLCIHPGCDQKRGRALGYCNAHYIRKRRGYAMDHPVRKHDATDQERFWAKIRKTDTCWIWTGATTVGYGVFRRGGENIPAHRMAFIWENGRITEGEEVDHKCFNHSCVRPDHLRLLTHSMNGQNRSGANKNSKSGVRGVYWVAARQVWLARAMLNRVSYSIGAFARLEDAEAAAIAWRREHMPASIRDREGDN